MEEENSLDKTIKDRKKITQEVKDNIINFTFFNIILATLMLIISLIINISFSKMKLVDFNNYIKYVQVILGVITIIIFEISYKKDSLKIALYGIEFAIFSVAVLYVPYMYNLKGNVNFLKNTVLAFSCYYVLKSCIIAIKAKNNFVKNNLSDIKELVKNDQKSYLDEDSDKTLKNKKKTNTKNHKNSV